MSTRLDGSRCEAELLGWRRAVVAMTAGVLLVLLATAGWLRPSPRGYGTHQGLGLPPCTIVQLWGRRCPACGMTTSWAWLMRGRVDRAFEANVGGAMLGLATMVATPWFGWSALRGKWWFRPPSDVWLAVGGCVWLAVTMTDWLVRLLAA